MSKITVDRELLKQAINALRNKYSDVIYKQSSDLAGDFELDLGKMQRAMETNSAEWTACVKLPVTVHVRQQRPGETHVSTREGITPVKPDDLIMRGVSGEEYPIGREIFERTYRIGEYRPGPETKQEPVAIHQVWMDRGWHDIPSDNVWRYSQDDWWDTRVVYAYPPTRNPLMDNLPSPDELEALSDGNDGMLLDLGFVQKLNALASWMRKYDATEAAHGIK